jgi:hypothetical protein
VINNSKIYNKWKIWINSIGLSYRNEELDIQNDRQWVRSKLNARGAKPFDFVQTAPPFNPSMPVDNPPAAGKLK